MRVLLLNPPITVYEGGTNPRIYMPLGLLYIAAHLEKEGHEVKVFDALLNAKLSNAEKKGRYHFGESWDSIRGAIDHYSPEAIGITSMFSSQSPNTKKTAEIAKKVDKNIITIVGGPHPSACPEDMLYNQNIDFIVIGEGEFVMPKLLNAVNAGKSIRHINGICYTTGEEVIKNAMPDRIGYLDEISLPAYHLYDMERYFYLQTHGFCARPISYGEREVSIITSRGCPYNCVFCSIHPVMGQKWRAHSAEYVLRHIKHLAERYKVNTLHIEDDNFALDKKRFIDILEGLSQKRPSVRWDPTNGLRADTLDEETILKAIRSGCQYIVIAIESGVQRVLDEVINKRLRLEKILEIAHICKKWDIELYAYYVVGFPGELLEEIKETLLYARRMLLKYFIYPQVAIASPIFGSRLYRICKERGYLADEVTPETLGVSYDAHGIGLIKTNEFLPADLRCLLAKYKRQFAMIMFLNALRRPQRLLKYIKTILRNPYLLKRLLANG